MIVTTTNSLEGKEISEYLGLASGEAILGTDGWADMLASFADLMGKRAKGYESKLREARETAVNEMVADARLLDANAVIGVDVDYETVGADSSMMMVTATGTAVRYR